MKKSEPRSRWLHEPLLHFAILAALLFAVDHVAGERRKEQIVVSKETVEFLTKRREDLELRSLTAEERENTINSFIEDEILYSEAYKRGLDRGDSRMRSNLILKMRGLLAGEVPEPTDEELRAWYETNREQFVRPPMLSMEQVFFVDRESVPAGLSEQLNQGLDPLTTGQEWLDGPRSLTNVTQADLVARFGPDAARVIVAIDDGSWHGPLVSPMGNHFVRITGREPARQMTYEQMQDYLFSEWMLAQTRDRIEREVAGLRENYEIVVEGEGE